MEKVMLELEEWLNPRIVADQLGVKLKRVYELIEEGKLEARRISPRTLRIPKHCLKAYMEENGITPCKAEK